MAKADTSVRWFHSGMADAPVLSGTAGTLIGVLDACLINGFSTRTPDSIVVSAGVATVSSSAGNPYEKHAVIVISGASDAALNAEWRVATAGASSFTFLCPGVADGTVSGATVKRAGAGWGKPFSDGNVGVYQSLDPNSTQLYLRVDDTNARHTLVRGYEQMTDVNTGVNPFPLFTDIAANDAVWEKSNLTSTTSRPWQVVADASMVYVIIGWHATYPKNADVYRFGDLVPIDPLDKYHCVLSSCNTSSPVYPGGNTNDNGPNTTRAITTGGGSTLSREASQTGSGIPSGRSAICAFETGFSTYGSEITFSEVWEYDGTSRTSSNTYRPPRGKCPGYLISTNRGVPLTPETTIEYNEDVLLVLRGGGTTNTEDRYIAFDVKGPWR